MNPDSANAKMRLEAGGRTVNEKAKDPPRFDHRPALLRQPYASSLMLGTPQCGPMDNPPQHPGGVLLLR